MQTFGDFRLGGSGGISGIRPAHVASYFGSGHRGRPPAAGDEGLQVGQRVGPAS